VLDRPSDHQRMIVDHLSAHADRLIVMSGIGATRLVAQYGVDPARIETIPHGVDPRFAGPSLVEGDRPLVLTWGIIGPGKGLESAIKAFADLVDLDPRPRYLIAGATHPRVREAVGESYRDGLIDLVRDHGLEGVVEFDNRYVDRETLVRRVRSADLVVLPYESVEQSTSGVLVEAIAAAKPVVATAFPHAVELLGDGAGIVVPHGDTPALTAALRHLITDHRSRAAAAQAAQHLSNGWDWTTVGHRFGRVMADMAVPSRSNGPPQADSRHYAVA
jgi:glycosyltransferase involved in cell wall biosynthesis